MRGAFKKNKCSLTVSMRVESVCVRECMRACVCVWEGPICDHPCLFNVSAQLLEFQGTLHAWLILPAPRVLSKNCECEFLEVSTGRGGAHRLPPAGDVIVRSSLKGALWALPIPDSRGLAHCVIFTARLYF